LVTTAIATAVIIAPVKQKERTKKMTFRDLEEGNSDICADKITTTKFFEKSRGEPFLYSNMSTTKRQTLEQ
jgi:hypothetical protein